MSYNGEVGKWKRVLASNYSYVRNLMRGNWDDHPDVFADCTKDHPPVLLLHGFLGTRGALFLLEQRLRSDGFTVFSVTLGGLNINDIRKSAYRIHLEVERILARADGRFDRIDIVGHSMGGLIGLYYAQFLGGHDRVRKLVTLGTPWFGTWFALLGAASPLGLLSPSTWQMIPGSDFLDQLQSLKIPLYVELTSIYGSDDVLCPPKSARRRDCVNYLIHHGHAGLTVSMDAHRIIRRVLARKHQPARDAGYEFELSDGIFKRRRLRRSRRAERAARASL